MTDYEYRTRFVLGADTLHDQIAEYNGVVHGDDATGAWDVQFDTVAHAVAFADKVKRRHGWVAELRAGEVIESLQTPRHLVLTVRGAEDARREAARGLMRELSETVTPDQLDVAVLVYAALTGQSQYQASKELGMVDNEKVRQ